MRVFYSPNEVAVLLGRTPARIYQMIWAKQLPATRIAGRWRIPVSAFDAWLAEHIERALASVR